MFIKYLFDFFIPKKLRDNSYRASHDPLTGLLNRWAFEDVLKEMLEQVKSEHENVVLVGIDIDNFSAFNNSLGYEAGDFVLKELAQRLTNFFPQTIPIARVSSDVFIVLLKNENTDTIKARLDNLLAILRKHYIYQGELELVVTCSMAVVAYPQDATTFHEFIRYGILTLNKAIYLNGNNIQYFNKKIAEDDAYRLAVQQHLMHALKNKEFSLNYQPQFSVASPHVIVGMEVLLRWYNPLLGNISPAVFVPIAEELNLIASIGDWALRESLKQYKIWQNKGFLKNKITLAVNFSMQQMRRPDTLKIIMNALAEADVGPSCFEAEITESAFLGESKHVIGTLEQLKQLGVSIALDDFGTGYSSLSYLQQIPLSILKIDQSFIKNFKEESRVLSATIELAHQFNLKIVAEGVETKEQLEFLQAKGCDYAQGFYFSKPLQAEAMEQLLLKG